MANIFLLFCSRQQNLKIVARTKLRFNGSRTVFFRSLLHFSTKAPTTAAAVQTQNGFLEEYLINSLGLSEEVVPAPNKVIRSKPIQKNPVLVVNFLENLFFNKNTHIKSIVSTHPEVLLSNWDKILKPKIKFLQDQGISGSGLVELIVGNKQLLTRNLDNHIRPRIECLKELLLGSDDIVVAASLKKYGLRQAYMESGRVSKNVGVLQNFGFSKENIAKILTIDMKFGIFRNIGCRERHFHELSTIPTPCSAMLRTEIPWVARTSWLFRSYNPNKFSLAWSSNIGSPSSGIFRAFSSLSSPSSSEAAKVDDNPYKNLEVARIDEVQGFPCLFVPSAFDPSPSGWGQDIPGRYHFLNLANRKLLNLEKNTRTMWRGRYLSPDDSKCVGSSKGWLAFINRGHGGFYLFNPLIPVDTFSYPFIPLPPLETLPNILSKLSLEKQKIPLWKIHGLNFHKLMRKEQLARFKVFSCFLFPNRILVVDSWEFSKSFIKKIVLSSHPSPFPSNSRGSDDDRYRCTAMIIHGESQLAFCRLGDETWTALKGPRTSYQDVMYFSKDQKFYALCQTDHIEAWDLLSCPTFPKMTLVKSVMPSVTSLRGYQLGQKKYLVDFSGELLLVLRFFNTFKSELPDKYAYTFTKWFEVFKLNFHTNKWVKMESLGDRSLFVGINECISVRAADYPGRVLREDSIYFTSLDAEIETSKTSDDCPHLRGAYDLGVFSLKHGEVDVISQDEFSMIYPHPVWIFLQL